MNQRTPFYLAILILAGFSVMYSVATSLPQAGQDSNLGLIPVRTQTAALDGTGSGLVGWWKFDETSGTSATDSVGGKVGELKNGATWGEGKIGGSIALDGVDDYVNVPGFNGISGAAAATVSFWVKPLNEGGFMNQWGESDAFEIYEGYGKYQLYWKYGSNIGVGGNGLNQQMLGEVKKGEWQHITAVYDGTNSKFYQDGVLLGTKAGTGGNINSGVTSPLEIGFGMWPAADYLQGNIDDVRIYSRALSDQEVGELFALGGGTTPPPPPPPPGDDAEAPSVPSGLSASNVTSSGAGLSWSASTDNVGVTGYKIFRNGSQVGTSNSTTYTASGLSPQTSYTFAVAAYDASNNTSAQSASIQVTTLAGQSTGTGVERLSSSGAVLASFATIQECANVVQPGETCLVYPGTYAKTDTDYNRVGNSGREGAPITFRGLPGAISNGFYVRNGSYFKIEGFTFKGAWDEITSIGDWMVQLLGNNNEVSNNTFTGNHRRLDTVSIQITGAVASNPVSVTAPSHGLTTGTKIQISGINGMTQLNDRGFMVMVTSPDTFTLHTSDGFDIDGRTYSAYTSGGTFKRILRWPREISGMVLAGGSDNYIHHNTFTDWIAGSADETGIQFGNTASQDESGNIAEFNTFEDVADIDAFRLFGHDSVIRNNIIKNVYYIGGVGSHIDFLSGFGLNGHESYNMLIEKNFVTGFYGQLIDAGQACGLSPSGQQEGACGTASWANGTVSSASTNTITDSNQNWITGNWTADHWKNAIITIVSGGGAGKVYDIVSNNANTLTVRNPNGTAANVSGDGVTSGSKYELRSRVGWWTIKNNVFDNSRYMDAPLQTSGSLSFLTFENNTFFGARSIFSGGTQNQGRSIWGKVVNNAHVSATPNYTIYSPQVPGVYASGDYQVKATFTGDYNFSAGPAPTYTAKDSVCSEEYEFLKFCEASWPGKHGINGGDPQFKNISNALGNDGVPWTSDDGFIPAVGSFLCTSGVGGGYIGAYSCSGTQQTDTINPTVTTFTIPSTSSSLTIPITSVVATDNIAVTGYMITESSSKPLASASGWSLTAPSSYIVSSAGAKTLYAYAKDAAGNVSTGRSASVTVSVVVSGDCNLATVRCAGAGQEYTTIQAAADAAIAGDTVSVSPGTYDEYVRVERNAGISGKPITFKGNGATVKGFWIKQPHITIDGFTVAKYGGPTYVAMIVLDPNADYTTITNNTIKNGVYLLSFNYSFSSNGNVISIPESEAGSEESGGFKAAGFKPGMKVYTAIDSYLAPQNPNHDKIFTVTAVTNNTVTVSEPLTNVPGPIHTLLYGTGPWTKEGVRGIEFTPSGCTAVNTCTQPDYVTITNNNIYDINGDAIRINGSYAKVENNVISDMHGWPVFAVTGHDNVFRYNVIKDSPRFAGFRPYNDVRNPDESYWDFVGPFMINIPSPGSASSNNIFEYNILKDLDLDIFTTEDSTATNGLQSGAKFILRNNVISGMERGTNAFHNRETIIENNTFYRSGFDTRFTITVASNNFGPTTGSLIRNNAFIGGGSQPDQYGVNGWYNIQYAELVEPANFNLVTGPGPTFGPKAGFAGTEASNLNGGDPKFRNVNDPVGPDGKPFTQDDGFVPQTGSALCGKGYNGTDIGAYSCGGTTPIDTTDPTVSITAPASGSTVKGTVAVSADANDNVGVVGVRFYANTSDLGEDTSAPYSVPWNTFGLADGPRTLKAVARDAAGNTKESTTVSVTVDNTAEPTSDTTAPTVPANAVAVLEGGYNIRFSWSASTDPVIEGQVTSGVARYNVYRNDVLRESITSLSTYDDALPPSTTFCWSVAAVDNAGNVSARTANSCVTTSGPVQGPDVTSPTVPTSLNGTPVSSAQINLSWAASTDPTISGQATSGLAGYKVYRNGLFLVSVTGGATTFQNNSGITANTTYTYQVSAYDMAGNESAKSTSISVTTPAAPSTGIQIGDRVQTTAKLKVRATASNKGTQLGTQPIGARGTVKAGPAYANGYTWWNVDFDTGADGWSAGTWLKEI